LLDLKFDAGFANTGALGGEAKIKVYAEGERPYLIPGPWGDCLDLTAASRFGGTIEQKAPAGSAVFFSDGALNSLTNFTIAFWLRAPDGKLDVSSRLLTKSGSWEVLYGRGRVVLLAVEGRISNIHGSQCVIPFREE
jgi:hypothetical protein